MTMLAPTLPSYLDQSPDVRARFDRLKQRPVILSVEHLEKRFTAKNGGETLA
ncbi:MAG: ABC transporter ATP-binding protein, partial [Rubrivivax sp.]